MTLPDDEPRCMGIDPDKRYMCPERHLCRRYDRAGPGERQSVAQIMREPGSAECEYMMRESDELFL